MTRVDGGPAAAATVGIVAICGAGHLARCLDALGRQERAPAFDVVVAADPRLPGLAGAVRPHPQARLLPAEGAAATPSRLAWQAVRAAGGATVLLTEDHCEPGPGWVRELCEAARPERGAAGGVVEIPDGASALDWAFSFSDFHRYAPPLPPGPTPALTICNVAYRRAHLDLVRPVWSELFLETQVHAALRERVGPLWLAPAATVTTRRHVRLADALRERGSFGRDFAAARARALGGARAAGHAAAAPLLPALLLARMARTCRRGGGRARAGVRGWGALVLLVAAWSGGECLGYLTRRPPRTLFVAPDAASPAGPALPFGGQLR